jgi:outer membrane protein OmpA-like peptidoglycan-associated protein
LTVPLSSVDLAPKSVRIKVENRRTLVTVDDVLFDPASAQLSEAAMQQLSDVAEFLAAHAKFTVLLEGHTDSVGTDERNFRLSRQRATAVKNFLVEKGIDPARLRTNGVGQTDPMSSNATAAGRRSVAVIVSGGTVQHYSR